MITALLLITTLLLLSTANSFSTLQPLRPAPCPSRSRTFVLVPPSPFQTPPTALHFAEAAEDGYSSPPHAGVTAEEHEELLQVSRFLARFGA
jgi:hypothetical protein